MKSMTQNEYLKNEMYREIEKIHRHFMYQFDTPGNRKRMNMRIRETKQMFIQKDRENKLKEILKND